MTVAERRSLRKWLDQQEEWTEDEWTWFRTGPVDGHVQGIVRRVRRILEVSQRGLADLLGVSQSVVARWETGRTSPRVSDLLDLLRMARLELVLLDDADQEVDPMRDDGVRTHGGSRFPAHVDLRVTGWWSPADVESTMVEYYQWKRRSKAAGDPSVRYRRSRWRRALERELWGTPDDHPSLRQCAAEAEHLDERREQRQARRAAA
ncbi:HTH-type transcriptional regulator / antitoxin HipB [Nocardioides exalbidus]|uniref:HTH-type transcriptional regulator / antitoxin HipB n=1 Tax=Nocardioides exalbidus TaxID=402596 RepID=A0A1H4I3W8_9ACTN|nr:helix-turn-helix transcriptional regulator [Nocardioides exalbidus]SEB28610.1 HTH-type transcriptional regulator / antitoxin HipB [Nocardioides exalbidus]